MLIGRRQAVLGAIAGVTVLAEATRAATQRRNAWADLMDEIGNAAVSSRTTAGLAVAVTDGSETSARGYGLANLETGTAVASDTVFRVASLTKMFTAAAIMLLRDRRRLSLEQNLSEFYPNIPGANSITLRQLLSHTSGLHDYVRGGLPADVGRDWSTAEEFAAGVARMEPLTDFAPGTRFSYSNTGYILLGGVIEKVSGASYERFLKDAIFGPCGMDRTAVDHASDVVPGRADGYRLADGQAGAFQHSEGQKLPFAAGAVRSSVTDLSRWVRCFMSGRVVSTAAVREMISPARVSGGVLVGNARWWPPGFDPGRPPDFATGNNYGLGWEMTTFFGQRTAGHSGGISGYNAILMSYLDRDLSIVVLSNTENGAIAPAFALMQRAGLGIER